MKSKSWYELTNFSGFWWTGKCWSKGAKAGSSSHRRLGTDGRKAWKAFYVAARKHGGTFILLHYFYKNGKRLCREWELVSK